MPCHSGAIHPNTVQLVRRNRLWFVTELQSALIQYHCISRWNGGISKQTAVADGNNDQNTGHVPNRPTAQCTVPPTKPQADPPVHSGRDSVKRHTMADDGSVVVMDALLADTPPKDAVIPDLYEVWQWEGDVEPLPGKWAAVVHAAFGEFV